MTDIEKELFKYQDLEYQKFVIKLTPGFNNENVIGVRVPIIKQIAKQIIKNTNYDNFLNSLPHKYYEENMLHSILLSSIKDFDKSIDLLNKYLPFVNNWAACDTLRPKSFDKNKDKLIEHIKKWSKSKHTYTCRFGIQMIMNFYLDKDFKKEYLEIPAIVRSEEYYVNMMIAWFYATALSKQWDATIPYIINKRLSKWCHNKTIQKAIESYRITPEQKEYLCTLKIKD